MPRIYEARAVNANALNVVMFRSSIRFNTRNAEIMGGLEEHEDIINLNTCGGKGVVVSSQWLYFHEEIG